VQGVQPLPGGQPPPGGEPPPAPGGAPGTKRKRCDAGVKSGANKRCRDCVQLPEHPCKHCANLSAWKPCLNKAT